MQEELVEQAEEGMWCAVIARLKMRRGRRIVICVGCRLLEQRARRGRIVDNSSCVVRKSSLNSETEN